MRTASRSVGRRAEWAEWSGRGEPKRRARGGVGMCGGDGKMGGERGGGTGVGLWLREMEGKVMVWGGVVTDIGGELSGVVGWTGSVSR